ncbi:uncharacterized protein C8A04DRAFT_14412 [Dichotomopilus funicola]|uniref:FAD-binding domain-containing protein n=1 Tax=Dichotomopilus funicola TaxID=1934379 RepID=A0AAN6ZJ09_9PEZI|nr:hypothetical protein C8A04DRAFT_14412 [Dichotomopilus funicola]
MSQHKILVNVAGDKHEFDPERWTAAAASSTTSPPQLPHRHPETGITVLIVGAGMGGLMSALECWRKGHTVTRILERSQGPVYSGDIIVMQPSALAVFRHWPDMARELETEQVHADVSYERHTGEHIYGPTVPSFNDPEHLAERAKRGYPAVAPAQIRRLFFRMLLRQVARIGLRVDYGCTVRDYFDEDNDDDNGLWKEKGGKGDHRGRGGVVLESGEVCIADVVIAADGLKSRSEMLVAAGEGQTTTTTPPRSSGMSIYRTAYPRELAMQDPTVRARWGDARPRWEYWLGPGMYMGIFLSDDTVSWGFTPRDKTAADSASETPEPTESWEPDADPEAVAQALLRGAPDWDPAVAALVRTAPRGAVVHWPLLWRDLRRTWTSSGSRVVQVGDSAHSFIPTSGNGATQALEDAVTLATCLQLAGSAQRVGLAAQVYNLLRYERVSCAQKMSFVNSQLKTATDWDAVRADPARIRTRFPSWIFKHDPEAYAYEKYGQAFAHLVAGAEFANTNFPPGHKFVPWTIDEVWRDMEAGKKVEDLLDGDWS